MHYIKTNKKALLVAKKTRTTTSSAKALEESLDALCRSYEGGRFRRYEMWCRWLDYTFAMLCHANKVYTARLCGLPEPPTFDHLGLTPEQIMLMQTMLDVAAEAASETYDDVLGAFYMGVDFGSDYMGQFFTPFSISRLTSLMTLQTAHTGEHNACSKRISIAEPSCGSGGLIIAATQVLRDKGFSNDQYYFVGADIDFYCVKMTLIQLTLYDIPALVLHQNTLSLDVWGIYPTFALLRDPLGRRERFIKHPVMFPVL